MKEILQKRIDEIDQRIGLILAQLHANEGAKAELVSMMQAEEINKAASGDEQALNGIAESLGAKEVIEIQKQDAEEA